MKILTNTRHWKQNAFALVEIKYNPEKDLLRAKLEMITKDKGHAGALARMISTYWVVETTAECSTPEQIVARAIECWQDARKAEAERRREFLEREERARELLDNPSQTR